MGNGISLQPKENDSIKTWAIRIYFAGASSVAIHHFWDHMWSTDPREEGIPNEINAVIRGLLWPVLYIPPVIIEQYKRFFE